MGTDEEHAAAAKIQAVHRGKVARRSVGDQREAASKASPPRRPPTSTTPSVLNSKVLANMGVVPRCGDPPIDPEDVLASIEAIVELILYDPKEPKEDLHYHAGSWLSTLTSCRGRVPVLSSPVLWAIAAVNVLLFFAFEWCGKSDVVLSSEAGSFFESVLSLKFTPLRLMSVGLMFLLIFRTQSAYEKWNVARIAWASVKVACRDISLSVCTYNRDLSAALTTCRYLLLFVVSLRCWLRERPIPDALLGQLATPKLKKVLGDAEREHELVDLPASRQQLLYDELLSFQFKSVCHPLVMLEGLRAVLNVTVEQGSLPHLHGSIEQGLKVMGTSLSRMESVQDTQLPFAYVVHIRTALVVFFLIAPLFLVHPDSGSGWFGLVFTLGFSATLLGLENLAEELSNPFGLDSNDLPSDAYTCNLARDISDAVQRRLAREAALAGGPREAAPPGGGGAPAAPGAPPAGLPAL